jgi:hypothetical protein
MKITKRQLKQIIKEEALKIAEAHGGAMPPSALGGDDHEAFSESVSDRLHLAKNFLDSFQYMFPTTSEEKEALNAVYLDILDQMKHELEP